jgi:RNA polymerase sigma-70 factor (ECF subfamily)
MFFQEYLEPVTRFAKRYTGNGEVAGDIAQESFIRLYQRWGRFDSPEKAKSFLYTTVRNGCLDYLKHLNIEKRYFNEQQPGDNPARGLPGDDDEFLHEVTYQETLRVVRAAIQKLSPRGRDIIIYGMNGKNNSEIAETMHISVNTVKTLKKDAYATLRELLKRLVCLLPLAC